MEFHPVSPAAVSSSAPVRNVRSASLGPSDEPVRIAEELEPSHRVPRARRSPPRVRSTRSISDAISSVAPLHRQQHRAQRAHRRRRAPDSPEGWTARVRARRAPRPPASGRSRSAPPGGSPRPLAVVEGQRRRAVGEPERHLSAALAVARVEGNLRGRERRLDRCPSRRRVDGARRGCISTSASAFACGVVGSICPRAGRHDEPGPQRRGGHPLRLRHRDGGVRGQCDGRPGTSSDRGVFGRARGGPEPGARSLRELHGANQQPAGGRESSERSTARSAERTEPFRGGGPASALLRSSGGPSSSR